MIGGTRFAATILKAAREETILIGRDVAATIRPAWTFARIGAASALVSVRPLGRAAVAGLAVAREEVGLIAKEIAADAVDAARPAWTGAHRRVASAKDSARSSATRLRSAASTAAMTALTKTKAQALNATKPLTRSVRTAKTRSSLFASGLRLKVDRAVLTPRRRPLEMRRRRTFGLGAVEVWTMSACAIFAAFVFLDASSVSWAKTIDPTLKGIFRWFTEFGKSDWLLVPMGLAIVWLAARPFESFRRAARARLEAWFWTLCFCFFVVAGSGLIVAVAKRVIGRARPKHFDAVGPFDFSPFALDSSYASFPSGHAATGFALAALVGFLAPRWRWPALAFAALLAVSRVAVGAHYPSDAVAGAAFAVWFAFRARESFAKRGLVFAYDAEDRLRLKTPRLLASAFARRPKAFKPAVMTFRAEPAE